MVDVDSGRSFSYPSRQLHDAAVVGPLDRIEGGWIFTENDQQTTSIEWIYSFVPKNEDAKIQIEENLLEPFQARLDHALTIMKEDLEGAT